MPPSMAAGLPCSRYRAPREVLRDEHLIARGSFALLSDSRGDFVVLNPPFRLTGAELEAIPRVGAFGEHTRAVLRELLGVDGAEFAALESGGALGAAQSRR